MLTEMDESTFSIATFYGRRVKRIFPAVAVMLFLNLLIANVLYVRQKDLTAVSVSTIWSLFSSSNFYYFLYAAHGYFAVETMLDPLTHLWSLGVEEQFYFVLPLILMKFHKSRYLKYIIGAMVVGSFVASEFVLQKNQMMAYYMLPFRMGELLIGSSIVVYDLKRYVPKRHHDLVGIIGMVMILAPVWLIDEMTPFPGFMSLLPTLGTACVIVCSESVVSRMLTVYPLQLFGWGSYSMYLYHWPFMAYLRLQAVVFDTEFSGTLVFLLVCNFAYLSYKLVEQPTRHLKLSNRQIFLYMFVAPFVVLLAFSAFSMHRDMRDGAELAAQKKQLIPLDLAKVPMEEFSRDEADKRCLFQKNICFYRFAPLPREIKGDCAIGDISQPPKNVLLW